jgi:arginase family enzyme
VLGEVRQTCELLVVIGGDDSLGYWSCRDAGLGQLVHIDAHEDAAGVSGPYPHHGNFISYLERDEPDLAVLQYGQRDVVPAPRREPAPRRTLCPTPAALCEALSGPRQNAADSGGTAISIDIDVLDPHVMPDVTNPLPNGLTLGELEEVVEAVVRASAEHGRKVRQLMLNEFAPADSAGITGAITAAHLLMRAIDACLR